ncbi:MAG: hypothetical protein IPP99_00430 [Chitinophagaceae bacterium]|nr:hypothetical protein [Chitinophagaceae bacterium]
MKSKSTNKKSQKKKIVITTLAVGAAGILGYFGWQYYKKKKAANKDNDADISFKRKTVADPIPVITDTPVYHPIIKPKSKT